MCYCVLIGSTSVSLVIDDGSRKRLLEPVRNNDDDGSRKCLLEPVRNNDDDDVDVKMTEAQEEVTPTSQAMPGTHGIGNIYEILSMCAILCLQLTEL